ncbi:MAG: hypothetical protein KDB00_22655 [Planctomycetales bacterium]|nr:hypothetical protein [Planctomycetales bacterium]
MANALTTQYPFYSRAYGGYTNSQEDFIREMLGQVSGKSILDPMAGQGYALSQLSWEGANVTLGDLNPATLAMASLRDPSVIRKRRTLTRWLQEVIARLSSKRRRKPPSRIVEGWIDPSIATDLHDYASMIGIGLFSNPFDSNSTFWSDDLNARFGAAIAILAARDIACFRTSDNVTWLKPGGVARSYRIVKPLEKSLAKWNEYAEQTAEGNERIRNSTSGSLNIELMNVAQGNLGRSRKSPWIITSPPYANRLDYTRMWAPEIQVLATMSGANPDEMRLSQIGTTVVEGIDFSEEEKLLPAYVRSSLSEIRDDPTKYSDIYYYPFFRNYAVTLAAGMRILARKLRVGGTMLVFIRDTTRKDVLFQAGRLVSSVLTSADSGLTETVCERKVIRQHIGYVRKSSSKGLYGLAQQEWWLAFKKPSKS